MEFKYLRRTGIGMLIMCNVHMRADSKQMALIRFHLHFCAGRVHPARINFSASKLCVCWENAGCQLKLILFSLECWIIFCLLGNGYGDQNLLLFSSNCSDYETAQFYLKHFVTTEIDSRDSFTEMQMHFQLRYSFRVPLRMPSIVCCSLSWIHDVRLVHSSF